MPNDKLKLLALVDQLRAAVLEMADDAPPGPVEPPAKPITAIVLENTGGAQTNVPFTFGQVFGVGEFQPGQGLAGRLDSGDAVSLQLDVKALHADGSVRHALVSGILPTLFADERRKLALVPVKPGIEERPGPLKAAVTARVTLSLGEGKYTADFAPGKDARWLDGTIVSELSSAVSLVDSKSVTHPHLHVRFAERCYVGERTRVEVVIENNWAYEPNPQNFTYDAVIEVGGKVVHEQKAFTHYHHARWREVFWFGVEPHVHVRHDPGYLIRTRALPNYDSSVVIAEAELIKLGKLKGSDKAKPMAVGMALPYMPNTGGRGDIGLNPDWAVAWLLSQDPRAADATLTTADLAGSWSVHYRDKNTGLPVSLIDYPYMTIKGNRGDTRDPATKLYHAFPELPKGTTSPNVQDVSHQPNLTYTAYLLTGEFYYLEELQFWAMYDAFASNPAYRENIKGLLKSEQVRGQAWGLRTISDAAYITPDEHLLKSAFTRIVESNLDWYLAEYVDNPNANRLGAIVNGYAITYEGKTALAPWMDDFFTSVVGQIAERGSEKALKLAAWKSTFVVLRMTGAGADPVFGAMYNMKVRDSETGPLYDNIAQVFKASIGPAQLAQAATLKVGEMTGYSTSPTGYPSNMQPALAFAADFGGEEGKRAWQRFMARSVKPDYGLGAQFAILPRTV